MIRIPREDEQKYFYQMLKVQENIEILKVLDILPKNRLLYT